MFHHTRRILVACAIVAAIGVLATDASFGAKPSSEPPVTYEWITLWFGDAPGMNNAGDVVGGSSLYIAESGNVVGLNSLPGLPKFEVEVGDDDILVPPTILGTVDIGDPVSVEGNVLQCRIVGNFKIDDGPRHVYRGTVQYDEAGENATFITFESFPGIPGYSGCIAYAINTDGDVRRLPTRTPCRRRCCRLLASRTSGTWVPFDSLHGSTASRN